MSGLSPVYRIQKGDPWNPTEFEYIHKRGRRVNQNKSARRALNVIARSVEKDVNILALALDEMGYDTDKVKEIIALLTEIQLEL